MAEPFDLCGVLRRIRRMADLSQRELASAAGLSVSAVAHAEAGRKDLPVASLVRAAALAGLRLALLDVQGQEVRAMAAAGVRDRGNRRYPAHLDVRHSDLGWWADFDRYTLERPDYTFDRNRFSRDWDRSHWGMPEDHLVLPDDSPEARRAWRRERARERERQERERLAAAGRLRQQSTTSSAPARPSARRWTTGRASRSTPRAAPVAVTSPEPLLP